MDNPDDDTIRSILGTPRTIAVVGWSANPARPSHSVARFLVSQGHRVIPVNPGVAGKVVQGERVRARLSDIAPEEGVDMVDFFRQPDTIAPLVAEAIESQPGLQIVWMQLGIANAEAARMAKARGLVVVQDRCPVIEVRRFGL